MAVAQLKINPSSLSQDNLREIIQLQASLYEEDFNLQNFMDTVTERVQEFTGATGAIVELVDGDDMVYSSGSGTMAPFIGLRLKMASSLSGLCVKRNEVMVSDDTSKDSRVDANACKKVNAASMVVTPLSRQNKVIGVLKVISVRPHAFDEYNVYALQLLAGVLGGALGQQIEFHNQQKAEESLRHMAQYDSLTGLPNRALFNDRLAHAIARHKRTNMHLGLMYMDIDYFKTINDTHGHAVGDMVLKEFASRIRDVVRTSDTFARLGGDEFVLIAENLRNAKEAEQIAAKVTDVLRSAFDAQGLGLKVSASIGVAVCSGKDINAETLLKRADDALYKVKKAGRNGFALEDSD